MSGVKSTGLAVFVLAACIIGGDAGLAQQVDRSDTSAPTPAEIALAAQCRDTYLRMRKVEAEIDKNRGEISTMEATLNKSGQRLDELESQYDKRFAKSQESQEAYDLALEAKKIYEAAAKEHDKLIDKQEKLAAVRTGLADEFNMLNPTYVSKCSGTLFKVQSIILSCKDEQSEWCDLLK